jgi:F420-dependent oxidoreductase-like protein
MRLGLNLGFWGSERVDYVALAREADALGYHSIWTAEAWGSDAVTTLTWLAAKTEKVCVGTAIMQMTARTPANTAMTAATLDRLTCGRMILGLGVSGPQVVEGWHGVPFGKPLARTREYLAVVRAVLKRERPLEHHGEYYDLPLRGGTGLGKPLRLMFRPVRAEIPIYLAALGPKNVALAAEIADGWLPIFFSPERFGLFRPSLQEGFARAGYGKPGFDIAPTVIVHVGDDVQACRDSVKPMLARYIGGMGARGANFYHDLACRYGYRDQADAIQNLFLDGNIMAAIEAVPDALVDEVSLCGPRQRIAERLAVWSSSGITTLLCSTTRIETVRLMAELVL